MIRLAVRVAGERSEEVLAELLELAPAGVEEVAAADGTVEYAVYGAPGELPGLPDLSAMAGGGLVEISTSEVADDWQERWKQFHRPVLVQAPAGAGVPSLRVRPPWEPAALESDAVSEIVIDPGQAFGTGGHGSTRLCLSLLLELAACDSGRGAVLDIGTGSGVLAIAAASLGYSPVLGLDHEAESVDAAAENAQVNRQSIEVRRLDLRTEPIPWLGGEQAPTGPLLVLANLLRPLLASLAESISGPPQNLIASGLLVAEADEIALAFSERHGLRERMRLHSGEWAAIWMSAHD